MGWMCVKLPVFRRIASGVNVMKRVHERADMLAELDSCDVGFHDFGGISEQRFGGKLFRWHPASMTLPQWERSSTQLFQTADVVSANTDPSMTAIEPLCMLQNKRFSEGFFCKKTSLALYL